MTMKPIYIDVICTATRKDVRTHTSMTAFLTPRQRLGGSSPRKRLFFRGYAASSPRKRGGKLLCKMFVCHPPLHDGLDVPHSEFEARREFGVFEVDCDERLAVIQ